MSASSYRWVIVAAGGLLGCVAIGGMFSLPVFLQPIARDTGWSGSGISSAMTIGFLAMAGGIRQFVMVTATIWLLGGLGATDWVDGGWDLEQSVALSAQLAALGGALCAARKPYWHRQPGRCSTLALPVRC